MDVYTPWPQRPPREFRGAAQWIAGGAVALYRTFAPFVERFAAVLFSTATLGACLFTWLMTLAFHGWWQVEAHVAARQPDAAALCRLSLTELHQAAAAAGTAVPA